MEPYVGHSCSWSFICPVQSVGSHLQHMCSTPLPDKVTHESRLFFQRRIWEQEQLSKEIDYSQTIIDPAPFQLVEDTSLYKVHSIFSMLGIRRAYVTKCGVLVGVVAVKEVSKRFCPVVGKVICEIQQEHLILV